MSSSDWNTIEQEFTNSSDWKTAVAQMENTAKSAANQAKADFTNELKEEIEVAQNLTTAIAKDPQQASGLSLTEAVLLYYFLSSTLNNTMTHTATVMANTTKIQPPNTPNSGLGASATTNPSPSSSSRLNLASKMPHNLMSMFMQKASLRGFSNPQLSPSANIEAFKTGKPLDASAPGWYEKGLKSPAINQGGMKSNQALSQNVSRAFGQDMAKYQRQTQQLNANMPNIKVSENPSVQLASQKAAQAASQRAAQAASQRAAAAAANRSVSAGRR